MLQLIAVVLLVEISIFYMVYTSVYQPLINISNSNECENNLYADTFYRQTIHSQTDFDVFAFKIGKIFSNNLSSTEIDHYSSMIKQDLLKNYGHNRLKNLKSEKNDPRRAETIQMLNQYNLYYGDFHNATKPQNHCHRNTDFFKFIQFNTKTTNVGNESLNFYNFAPIEHVLKYPDNRFYAHFNGTVLNSTQYTKSKLFSYTISVDEDGYLPSLELRMVEISELFQHDVTRHIIINGVRNKLLWAGECYYIYDLKVKKYAFILDNASGHFKPNMRQLPTYLDYILITSLFPFYENNDEYRPIMMIDREEAPWKEVKKYLFPILHDIGSRDKLINVCTVYCICLCVFMLGCIQKMSRALKEKKHNGIDREERCDAVIGAVAEKLLKKNGGTLEEALKTIKQRMLDLQIACSSARGVYKSGFEQWN